MVKQTFVRRNMSLILVASMVLMSIFQAPIECFAENSKVKNVASSAGTKLQRFAKVVASGLGGLAAGAAVGIAAESVLCSVCLPLVSLGPIAGIVCGYLAYKGIRKLLKVDNSKGNSDEVGTEKVQASQVEYTSSVSNEIADERLSIEESNEDKSVELQKLRQEYYEAANNGDSDKVKDLALKLQALQ